MTATAMVVHLKAPLAGSATSAGPAKPKIIIGICTRERNALLRRLLDSIWAQPIPPDHDVAIVIIDNNDEAIAGEAITGLSDHFPITILHEPRAGLVNARNRALEAATEKGATWFIGVDDDEWVAPDWLAQFVKGFDQTDTPILIAPTEYVYDDSLSSFLRQRQMPKVRRGQQPAILASGNYAMHQTVFDPAYGVGLRFDPAFNESGGEDYDFFLRAKRMHDWQPQGWPDAMAYEEYIGPRATLRYRLKRSLRAQVLMHLVARRHQRAGLTGTRAGNLLRVALRINRHFVYGAAGLLGGCAKLPFTPREGRYMIGEGLERWVCAFAVVPYLLERKPVAYGPKVASVHAATLEAQAAPHR